MICKKCGRALPNEGAICNFCGAMMDKNQINTMKSMNAKKDGMPNLMSDRYGVDKSSLYNKEEAKGENKLLGAFIILIILVFLIILAILLNIGK